MVVDQPLTLRAGTELFTLIVVPPFLFCRPAFTENMTDRLRDGAKGAAPLSPGTAGGLIRASSSSSMLAGSPGGPGDSTGGSGCPILMQTGPNVKVTAEVPRAEVVVHLPSLMAFVATHFR